MAAHSAQRGMFSGRRLSAIALLLLLLLLGVGTWYWWFTRQTAILVGQVVDTAAGNKPIPGAEVLAVGTARTVRADRQGRFQMNKLPTGPIDIKVSAPGYESQVLAVEMVGDAETRLDVALGPARKEALKSQMGVLLKGRVLDSRSGEPLQGVKIVIKGAARGPTHTNRDGCFEFANITEKKAEILAEAPGYRATAAWWLAEAKPPVIRLTTDASLSGQVFDDAYKNERPVVDAIVRVAGDDQVARSDRQGRFRLDSLPGGQEKITLEASAAGYTAKQISADLTDPGRSSVEVRLLGASQLTGKVTERITGKPIVEATVALKETRLKTRTDADGRFALSNVPPGEHTVCVVADDFNAVEQAASITPGKNTVTDVVMTGANRLRGVVVWQGRDDFNVPIPKATVSAKGTNLSTVTDRDGRFAVDGLPPERTTLLVRATGFHDKEVHFDPRSDNGEPIMLAGNASATGRVVDAAVSPARPIPGATVRIDQSPLLTHTDSDGRFTLNGAKSGTARIVATASGYTRTEIRQDLPAEVPQPLGDIKLTGGCELEGTVVEANGGSPIVNAEVRIVGSDRVTKSDAAGRYRFVGLSPAATDLAVTADGRPAYRVSKELEPGRNILQIPLGGDMPGTGAVVNAGKTTPLDASDNSKVARVDQGMAGAGGSLQPPGSGAGTAPSSGGGGGADGTGGSGNRAEPGRSWLDLSDGERAQKVAFYIATGVRASRGRVYMVSTKGNLLDSVGLQYAPTGMVFHKESGNKPGLLLAIPRDYGRVMRIDHTSKASTILEKDPVLPHPVDIAIAGSSDDMYVADDIANVLAHTNLEGRKAEVFRGKPSLGLNGRSALDEGMSLAATMDKHLVFGSGGQPGVYRYSTGQQPDTAERVLPDFGGVAADSQTSRWAAAQEPDQIYVYEGQQLVRRLFLPSGLIHYRKGLLAFTHEDGWLCIACQQKGKPDDGVWLYICYDIENAQFERLFRWGPREWKEKDMPDVTFTDKDINDFAVGPWMPWPRAILASGFKTPPKKRPEASGPAKQSTEVPGGPK